ncbi:MAG: tRNA lysidine(34) synthetase TilS [Nitrospinae bacterium]|nr:tRNA lysidine(34) synthetase TilS [Nitrospinota bacterium]
MFTHKLLEYLRRHRLTDPGEMVCVAASGGADSTALLTALYALKDELKIGLSACHVNHGLRGAESDADAEFVELLSKRLSIPCVVEKVDVAGRIKVSGGTVQSTAREMRYGVFERILDKGFADKIATAHTADDNAETVLLNLLRGSGPAGLSGIPRRRGKGFIRPLLGTRKWEVLAHLESTGTAHREDSTNAASKYARNRVRNELIPLLEKEHNPAIVEALCKTAEIMADASDFIEHTASELFDRISEDEGGGRFTMRRADLAGLHPALQREVIRHALTKIGRGLADVTFEHTENIRLLALESVDGDEILRGAAMIRVAHDLVHFFRDSGKAPAEFSHPFIRQGSVYVGEIGRTVAVETVDRPPPEFDPEFKTVFADFDSVPDGAFFRNRRSGDVFHPIGASGTMKLKKFLIDRKIPRWERDSLLLLAHGSEILWVAGIGLSERVRLKPGAAKILKIGVQDENFR